jgi:hypothetical protein
MSHRPFLLLLTLAVLMLAGCGPGTPGPSSPGKSSASDEESKIKAALAELSPEDRKLAEQQKVCAVHPENRLGSMGKPDKVMVKDEPVFLCCDGCRKKVESEPDTYLAKAKELRGEKKKKD